MWSIHKCFIFQLTIDGLEKERDFYFGKLRDIEVMCQESEDGNSIIQRILEVLYATEVRLSLLVFWISTVVLNCKSETWNLNEL